MAQEIPTKPTVVVLSESEERPWPGLESLESEVTLVRAWDEKSLAPAIGEADVLLVTDFRTEALEETFAGAERLRWIHATSAGVDALMFPALVASEVSVTNARGVFDRAIAEYVLGLILAYAKDFRGTLERQARREWEHRDTERIDGKRALIVGAGSIGQRIGLLLRAVGMAVEGLARTARRAPDFGEIRSTDDLPELLPEADYVVIATPLTEATRGLFGAGEFSRMKPTARLINIGRGPVVQTGALVEALRAGEIAGAALDVFEEEPLPADHPLWSMPQVVVSPHMSADFVGWREVLSQQFIDNFRRFQSQQPLENLVDKRRYRR